MGLGGSRAIPGGTLTKEKDKLDELLEAEERKEEAADAKEEEDVSSVLKEGRKIGDSYYLVEMSTDGRTLTISAYDGDTQQTLELLINEKNHRKLHRECDGDYSQLATRLAVEGDRLLLKPLVQAAEP